MGDGWPGEAPGPGLGLELPPGSSEVVCAGGGTDEAMEAMGVGVVGLGSRGVRLPNGEAPLWVAEGGGRGVWWGWGWRCCSGEAADAAAGWGAVAGGAANVAPANISLPRACMALDKP